MDVRFSKEVCIVHLAQRADLPMAPSFRADQALFPCSYISRRPIVAECQGYAVVLYPVF
jgi:hypothetical protein